MSDAPEWWLGFETQQYNTPTTHARHDVQLIDGPHNSQQEANNALFLHQSLGLTKRRTQSGNYVAVCLFPAVPDRADCNEEAISTLNAIGLKP